MHAITNHQITALTTAFEYSNAGEEGEFFQELAALAVVEELQPILRQELLPLLLAIYRREEAEVGLLEKQLRLKMTGTFAGIVAHYLQSQLGGMALPERPNVLRTFLRLDLIHPCGLAFELLPQLDLLDRQQLRQVTELGINGLMTLTEVLSSSWLAFSTEQQKLFFTILVDGLQEEDILAYTADELPYFIRTYLPAFQAVFPRVNLIDYPLRLARWYTCWQNHVHRNLPDLALTNPYYQQDFGLVIRYVPPHIWWNDGLQYGPEDKAFQLASPGFRYLAIGGSIRRWTEGPAYSRRMARAFSELPPLLEQGDWDMYFYCFVKSLGGGPILLAASQQYLQRPTDPGLLPALLDRWNPIIQKLADPEFERFSLAGAQRLLGYCYHLLRDQRDFHLRGCTVAEILEASLTYYDNIANRQIAQAAAAVAKQEEANARKNEWMPARNIYSYTLDYDLSHSIRRHQIRELTNREALLQEGAAMSHCVASYAWHCMNGECSIWSLKELGEGNHWKRLVTIRVATAQRKIVEVRTRFNAIPPAAHLTIIKNWAKQQGLTYDPTFEMY